MRLNSVVMAINFQVRNIHNSNEEATLCFTGDNITVMRTGCGVHVPSEWEYICSFRSIVKGKDLKEILWQVAQTPALSEDAKEFINSIEG